MGTKAKVRLPLQEIEAFCKRWKIQKFALFGSVPRDDFGPASDIDVLVTGTAGSLSSSLSVSVPL
jgi:predicted nucleotidyltransferase